MTAHKILVIGPNLTMQYVHQLPRLQAGAVNRVQSTSLFAAGKGVNVTRALKRLNLNAHLLVFSGGSACSLMQDLMLKEGLAVEIIPMEAELRVTNTVLAGAEVTEIIGQSPVITVAEQTSYLNRMQELLTLPWDGIIFTGTSPETGLKPSIYELILEKLRNVSVPVVLDLSKGLLHSVRPEPRWILKINWDEFTHIFGHGTVPLHQRNQLMLESSWQRLLITDGAKPARMKWDRELLIATPPDVPKLLNPIGAGDACCAAFLKASLEKLPLQKCLEYSLYVASRSCSSLVPGEFDLESHL